MATAEQILQLFKDAEGRALQKRIESEPSTPEVINNNRSATTALQLFSTYDEINKHTMPKTYEDLAKIVKIQTRVKPLYEPKMGTVEYVTKSVYSKLVETPIYALGEGAAAALEAGARAVGLQGIASYFKESKEMWKTPPATKDVHEQFAWLLESAKKKSTMHGMVVEMAEIGAQIGSLLIQMGLLGKVPGIKAIDTTMFAGTAPLPKVGRQMAAMFAHGVATTPGDLSNRFTAGVTRMAYNMTPYIANWTGATGWGARAVDMGLNMFLTSPSYIKSMKEAKNPMDFIMRSLPQFMTDFIFALNTKGTPMNQRLKALGQKPSIFGTKVQEKEAFLSGVDRAIDETARPYGEEAPEPSKKQVVARAMGKAKVEKAERGLIDIYRFAQLSPPEQFRATIEGRKPVFLTGTQSVDYKKELRVAEELGMRAAFGEEKAYAWDKGKVVATAKPVVIYPAKNKARAMKVLDLLKKPDFSPKYHAELGRLLGYSKAEIGEFLARQPKGAIVPTKIPAKRITAGKRPGIILTKTDIKKRAALLKKAVASAKMDALVDPINRGRRLPADQLPIAVSESKNVWETIGYGWGVLHLGNMRAERLFEELDGYRRGPNTEVGYVKINEAANNKIRGITKGTDAFTATITELGIKPTIDRFYANREFVGTQMALTKTEMVDIYMDMQNPKAIKHLTKSKAQNGMGFKLDDLNEVRAAVEADPQMKGLADWLFGAYERWYPIVADIYFKETGKPLPKEPYYSPLRVMREFIDFDKDNYAQDLFNRYHIDGYVEKGFTKERQAGASQPIKLDAIGNYLYNLSRIEHYVNFALPLKELKSVMNNTRWRKAVTDSKGETFYKNIKKYYDAVAGTKPMGADEVANKAMGFLRTNAGTAMLGFNVLTTMRQPLSIFQATAEIGVPHVFSAMRQLLIHPKALERFVYDRSNMVKYRRGQFERFVAEKVVSIAELMGRPKAPKAITGRMGMREAALAMAIFMDKNTVLSTWKAAYDKVTLSGRTLDGEKIATKDLEKAARMEADLAVRRTQPMATVKDLPAWHRSSSFLRLFTMFQNQINNNYNYFAHDIIGKTRAGKITPIEAAQKTLFAYILPAMVLGMIARGGLPRNEKQIGEDLAIYPMAGLFFVGGIVNSAIKGYASWGVPPLQFAPDLMKMYTSKTWKTKIRFGLKGVAEITGIPYNQLYRTWKGMQELMDGSTDDWRRLIWSEYSLTKGLPEVKKGGLKVFKRKG